MENNPRFGEIIYANLPYCGSVQGGIRPVLVVQNDVGNRHAPTVEVIPLSSRINKGHHKITLDCEARGEDLPEHNDDFFCKNLCSCRDCCERMMGE